MHWRRYRHLHHHYHHHHRHCRHRPPLDGMLSHPPHHHRGQRADCGFYLRIRSRCYRVPVRPCDESDRSPHLAWEGLSTVPCLVLVRWTG